MSSSFIEIVHNRFNMAASHPVYLITQILHDKITEVTQLSDRSFHPFQYLLHIWALPNSGYIMLRSILSQNKWGTCKWHLKCLMSAFLFILKNSYPKMKICWKCTRTQVIQDVDEFVSSSEQIWRNVALHHLLTDGPSAVNGCRQNESPNSWWNIIIIHK